MLKHQSSGKCKLKSQSDPLEWLSSIRLLIPSVKWVCGVIKTLKIYPREKKAYVHTETQMHYDHSNIVHNSPKLKQYRCSVYWLIKKNNPYIAVHWNTVQQ